MAKPTGIERGSFPDGGAIEQVKALAHRIAKTRMFPGGGAIEQFPDGGAILPDEGDRR